MKNKEFPDMGDQIKDLVQNAIHSMDFKNLNEQISSTVNSALEEVKEQLSKTASQMGETVNSGWNISKSQVAKPETTKMNRAVKKQKASVSDSKAKTVGILCVALGSAGAGMTFIGLICFGIAVAFTGTASFLAAPGFLILGLLFVMFCILYGNGTSHLKRAKRLKRYYKALGEKSYCSIKELAAYSGKSEKFVYKDLLKMIDKGMIPEGHLDHQGTCLMMDDETYSQYLEARKSMEQREEERQSLLKENSLKNQQEEISQELEQLIIKEEEYIRQLRRVNDLIPGEIISAKLFRLDKVITDIFDTIKKHPSQIPQMQKFMDYYMPTTLKLVTAYQEFDSLEIQGDNVKRAKAEVEKILDTINQAFENLLDDLYQSAAFDVATDASVLQTMFAKEGLMESDFKEER